MLFAYGVGAAVLGLALSYFTNWTNVGHASSLTKHWEHPYIREGVHTARWARFKNFFHVLAVLVGLASLLVFIIGMFDVRDTIVKLAATKS